MPKENINAFLQQLENFKGIDAYQTVFAFASNQQFSLKDADVSSRIFHSWKKEGIVGDDSESREWVKLNLFELIWVCSVQQMRNMGVPIEKILELRNDIFSPFDFSSIQNTRYRNKIQREFLESDDFNEETKSNFKQILSDIDGKKKETLEILKEVNLFKVLCSELILKKKKIGFLTTKNNKVVPFMEENISIDPNVIQHLLNSHIFVSLNDVLEKLSGIKNLEELLLKFPTEKEREVINILRSKEVKEVTIKYIEDAPQITKVRQGNYDPEISAILQKYFHLKKGDEIILKNRGNVFHYEKKLKANL